MAKVSTVKNCDWTENTGDLKIEFEWGHALKMLVNICNCSDKNAI